MSGQIDREHQKHVLSPADQDLAYLQPGQLAALLKVSKRTLEKSRQDGTLTGWDYDMVGKRVRYYRRAQAHSLSRAS